MRITLLLLILLLSLNIQSQSSGKSESLEGVFSTFIDGVTVTIAIEHKAGTSYTGVFNDGYQTSPMVLDLAGTTFTGVLTEPAMGIGIDVYGEIQGNQLNFNLIVDPLGEVDPIEINFMRDGAAAAITSTTDQGTSNVQLPSGASHPAEFTGTWTKEELYQSGSGDSYMGAGFSQSMTFLPDGGLAEGGSSAYLSGSNYSGQSSAQGTERIPGVTWYTIGNQLYMQVTENAQTQNVHLGKYYIENNNMLITGTNGEKILLTRSN